MKSSGTHLDMPPRMHSATLRKSRRRIGILRVGSLGDHLITLPLYRSIKEAHPDSTLVLISNLPDPANRKIIGPASILPPALIDEFQDYPVGSNVEAMRLKYRLFRAARLEVVYYLMPRRSVAQLWRDRLFFLFAGVPVIGLRTSASAQVARRSSAASVESEHELERLARLLPVSVSKAPDDLSLDLTAAEHAAAREALGGAPKCMVAISIGAKLEIKDWGIDRWSELVAALGTLHHIDRLVFIGAPDEFVYSEKLLRHWPRKADNFCGLLSPRMSAAVLAQALLFIGHDSGPMHMAAAVAVPIVAIFSSRALPGVWFPLSERKRVHYSIIGCMGCEKLRCDDLQKACIRNISVADVYASCVAALDEPSLPSRECRPDRATSAAHAPRRITEGT